MNYQFRGRYEGNPVSGAMETSDGVVLATTPAFAWAKGKQLESVLAWLEDKGFRVFVSMEKKDWTQLI